MVHLFDYPNELRYVTCMHFNYICQYVNYGNHTNLNGISEVSKCNNHYRAQGTEVWSAQCHTACCDMFVCRILSTSCAHCWNVEIPPQSHGIRATCRVMRLQYLDGSGEVLWYLLYRYGLGLSVRVAADTSEACGILLCPFASFALHACKHETYQIRFLCETEAVLETLRHNWACWRAELSLPSPCDCMRGNVRTTGTRGTDMDNDE